MEKSNRLITLYTDNIRKDKVLWDELEKLIKDFKGGAEDHELVRMDLLMHLIHDNNYMLVNIGIKLNDGERWSRNRDGNK